MSAGVLNQKQVREELIANQPPRIKSLEKIIRAPDPSAIDLPLGQRYYEMSASCRPHKEFTVQDLIQRHGLRKEHDRVERILSDDTVFRRNHVYLVALEWGLELPPEICVRSTAKSSTGRLDALVRLVADHQPHFDRIDLGGKTQLFLEVVPITFPLKVRPGMSLSQIRFMRGTEELCTVPPEALAYEKNPVLVDKNGDRVALATAEGDRNGVLLSLDLTPDPRLGFVGFVAKRANDDTQPIDPSVRPLADGQDGRYDPAEFWEPVLTETDESVVRIERDRFYIFRSKERFKIPAHLAVECQAYSESLGDIRIHYAGFAHPFFGFSRDIGTPLIFEVRGFSMDTILRDGTPLAKVHFRRMAEPAEPDQAQVYNEQELQLSACFKEWKV